MKKFCFTFICVFLAFQLALPARVLAATRAIKNVRVTDEGKKQYYDLFQSPVEKSLWYCGQIKPTVLTRLVDSQEIPEVSIIRFQKKNVKNPQQLDQGAYFRMYLSLGPSEEVLELLRKKIPDSGDRPVILSPVPFGALKLYLYRPDGKQILLTAERLTGISGQRSSQNVAFSTLLGKTDTDLLDSLLRGNTGAKYLLQYNYEYVDPVISKKSDEKLPGGRDLSGSSTGGDSSDRDLPGSRDLSELEKKVASESGWDKAGEGFIGLGRYSRSIQDQCIIVEDRTDQWENAYLTLPVITMPTGIDISRIELDVSLMHGEKAYSDARFTWTPSRTWRDSHGAPLVYGIFDLSALRQKHPDDLNSAWFSIRQRIESNDGDALVSESRCEMLEGDSPVSDPLQLADVLEFETGLLTWAPEGKDGLKRIEIELKDADWKSQRTVEPARKNDRLVAPEALRWLVRREKPVLPNASRSDSDNSKKEPAPFLNASVHFIVAAGKAEKRIPWELNGLDLRKELVALSAVFFDKDWSGK